MGWADKARKAGVVVAIAAAASFGLSPSGEDLVINHEGNVRVVYLDPVNIPTVCVGHTGTVSRADVGKRFSEDTCRRLLREDVTTAVAAVRRSVRVPITQNQFDALVSLAFNIGAGAFHSSTLVRKLNAGDYRGAGEQFHRWVYAGGKRLNGLVKRRADEAALFMKDIDTYDTGPEERDGALDKGIRGTARTARRRELELATV